MTDFSEYDILTERKLAAADVLLNYEANSPKHWAFHQSTSKTRLILGGKRSGKTTANVVEACWAGLGIHPFPHYPPPPLKIRACGMSNESIRAILLPMFLEWLPRHAIKKLPTRDDMTLYLTNGTFIEFRSYEQDVGKFEGTERHLVIHDEEPPREIYESNFMRTISKNISGKIVISCTPLHGMNWIYDELYDNPKAVPPAVEHWHISIYDNPHLDAEDIETIKNDPAMQDSLDSVMYGLFVPKSGLVYKAFDEKIHVLPLVSKPNDDWLIVLGIDPHNRNPHGVVFAGLNKDNAFTIYDEIYEHCTIGELAAKIKAKMGTRWPPNLCVADTSANTPQSISGRTEAEELQYKHGLYIVPAHKDLDAGIAKVTQLLQTKGLFITENCRNVIREFRHYVWDDYVRRKDRYDPKEKPRKKDDHLLDCARYVSMAQIYYRPPGWKYQRKEHMASKTTGYFSSGKDKVKPKIPVGKTK